MNVIWETICFQITIRQVFILLPSGLFGKKTKQNTQYRIDEVHIPTNVMHQWNVNTE